MLQPHIKLDTIEKYVLLPGDPDRIDSMLKFMTDIHEPEANRGYRSARGNYDGIGVSMISSGIGCPSAAIVVEELAEIGAETIIRVGTCGGLLADMEPGDIVIPSAAYCGDGTTRELQPDTELVYANQAVLEALISSAQQAGARYFVGVNRTHDAFYEPTENFVKLEGKGFVSSEMEVSVVYMVSEMKNIKAGTILVVNTPEPPEKVRIDPNLVYRLVDEDVVMEGVDNAIKIALEAVKMLAQP